MFSLVVSAVLGFSGANASVATSSLGDQSIQCSNNMYRESSLQIWRHQGVIQQIQIKDSHVQNGQDATKAVIATHFPGLNPWGRNYLLEIDARKLKCTGTLSDLECESVAKNTPAKWVTDVFISENKLQGMSGIATLGIDAKISEVKVRIREEKANPQWPRQDTLYVTVSATVNVRGTLIPMAWDTFFYSSQQLTAQQATLSGCDSQ
ncbi:MAG: hypothetical protein JNL01_06860 [Bdellovibrionales bacterium]|nr:hypothetical protein [Bdellovibrionales bacterium]